MNILLWYLLHISVTSPLQTASSPLSVNGRRWHPFPTGVSTGEAIVLLIFLGFSVFWLYYWCVLYSYSSGNVDGKYKDLELAARVVGFLLNLVSALLLLPASRTCLWVTVFAIPFERAVAYHRLLGVLSFFLMSLHMLLWWSEWGAYDSLAHNVITISELRIFISNTTAHEWHVINTDWTIPLCELLWLVMFLSLLFTWFLRRRFYTYFQYVHKYIGIVYFIVALIHSWSFW